MANGDVYPPLPGVSWASPPGVAPVVFNGRTNANQPNVNDIMASLTQLLGPDPTVPTAPSISTQSGADAYEDVNGWPGALGFQETDRERAQRLAQALATAQGAALAARTKGQANVIGAQEDAQRQLARILSEAPPAAQPFTPPAPVTRQTLAYPTPAPLPRSRGADIAAALASIMVPQIAGRAGAAVTGAMKQEQAAQDAYNKEKFGYDVNRSDQAFQDEQANRAEQIRYALLNRDVNYQNALRQFQAQQAGEEAGVNIPVMQAQRTGLEQEAAGIPQLAQSQFAAGQAGAEVQREDTQAQQEKQRELELYKDAINAYHYDKQARTQALTQGLMYDRALNVANTNAGARGYAADLGAMSRLTGQGYAFDPNNPFATPAPIPQGQLSAQRQAQIGLESARTDYYRNQVANARAGKAIDPTKATPEQRLALAKLLGARQAYTQARDIRLRYMADPKKYDAKAPDQTYWALTHAAEQAATDYQAADAQAHSLMTGKGAPAPPVAPTAGVVKVGTQADYDKLPSGQLYIGPSGKVRRKP